MVVPLSEPAGTSGALVTSVQCCDLQRQAQELAEELTAAAERVIRSGRYILGPQSDGFEHEVASYLGVTHAIGVASGSDALALALMAAGVQPGHQVLTTPFTFFATAEAVLRIGARPVFADVDPVTFNLDADGCRSLVERSVIRSGRSRCGAIRAILPVHLFGHPAQMDAFMKLAEDYELIVVEDAAQAMGADYGGQRVGSVGHAGCFSFFPSKNLGALGDGGLVTTNDSALATLVRQLRAHGTTGPYVHEKVGTNSRLDEMQSAFLRIKLRRLESWIALRREHASSYASLLASVEKIRLPEDARQGRHVFHQFTVCVPPEQRDGLRRHLGEAGINTAVYYSVPLHLQPALQHLGHRRGDFPVAEAASRQVLSLPMFPELRIEEIEYVAHAVGRYLACD